MEKERTGGLIIAIISLACLAVETFAYFGGLNPTLMLIILAVAVGAVFIVCFVTEKRVGEEDRQGNQKEKEK